MSGQIEVSLGDKSVELSLLDRYKGAVGRTDRIALVSKALLRGNSHFFNGRTFRCLTEDIKNQQICCEKVGAPLQRFGTVVFQYVVDQDGSLFDEEKCQGTLKIWLLSEARYQELSDVAKQWPLMDAGLDKPQHDLIIKTTEEKFQRMTITPCPISHWKKKELWYRTISARVAVAKDRVAMALGKKFTEAEVKEILGLTVSAQPPTQRPGDIDLTDILETQAPITVAAPAPTSTTVTVSPAPIAAQQGQDIPL